MNSALRMDLVSRFQREGVEFPINPMYASLKENAPAILKKMDDLALQRFKRYRNQYDEVMTANINRTPELVRQEFIEAWGNVGKEMGKVSAPSVTNTASFVTGTVGGIFLTTVLGPLPSTLIGGAAAITKIVEGRQENSQSLPIYAGLIFAHAECSLLSGEALYLRSREWEWPAAVGGTVGEWAGRSFGQILAFVRTPQDKQAPDLKSWQISVCKEEIEALEAEQEELKEVQGIASEDQEIIKEASAAIAFTLRALEGVKSELEKGNQ